MKMRKLFAQMAAVVAICGVSINANAQSYEEWAAQQRAEQQQFVKNERKSFEQFVKERDEEIKKMDSEFSEFLKKEWKNYQSLKDEYTPEVPKPKQKPVYQATEKQTKQLKIENVVKIEAMAETPKLPFLLKSESSDFTPQTVNFNFYGSAVQINYDRAANISLNAVNEQNIANAWEQLSKTNYSCTINDLLNYKNQFTLNDWGYYLLTKNAAQSIAKNKNTQTILTWFLLTKSNYKARLAFNNNSIYLLLPSANNIYGYPYFTFDGRRYYMVDGQETNAYTYDKDFPEARQIMDLNIYRPLNTANQVATRAIGMKYDGENYQFNINYNKNIIDFYNNYPQADIKIYFDAALSRITKESLLSALMPVIANLDVVDATSFLLSFVQAFAYKTDDEQFGHEKFFFPDEMFFYQYSDCEDRAVLFAYLVKQLVGLDVIGLNYPGHMATAVNFNKNIEGAYVTYNGKRYTICDPTYIGAPVGEAMPKYAQASAAVIENAAQPNLADRASKLWRIANKYGLYQGDNNRNITFNADGDAFMCGYFNGNIDFMGQPLTAEGSDIFVARINADNSLGFLFKIGSKADDIAYNILLGTDDSFYFSGSFNADLTIDGKTMKANNGDVFIAKCSRDGKVSWINQANIGQLDSLSNTFAAYFDKNGKRLWTRTYAENEDFTDYGISIDDEGNSYLTGSLLASVGLMNRSYESVARKSAFAVSGVSATDNGTLAPEIASLLAIVNQLNTTRGSLTGDVMQHTIDVNNPQTAEKSPSVYQQFGNVEFIRNNQGIVTVRTTDGKPAQFNSIKLANNSKFKISIYSTGNAQIDFLSGSQYGDNQVWHNLNFIKLYKISGNLTFDYDIDHSRLTMSAKQIF